MARWALGSDDCILPASLLCLAHSAWLLVLLPLTLTTLTTQHTTDPPSQVSAARINNNNLICLQCYCSSSTTSACWPSTAPCTACPWCSRC